MNLQRATNLVAIDSRAEALSQAKELEARGEYEAARQALAPYWYRVGEDPKLDGLPHSLKGELLLQVGSLTRWLGSAYQITDAMEIAKNLATKSIEIFKNPLEPKKLCEAYTLLAAIYGREGAYDEARISTETALGYVKGSECDEKASAHIVGSQTEIRAKRYQSALIHINQIESFIESSQHSLLKGLFHMNRGIIFQNFGQIDISLIEYAGAAFHFREGKHLPNHARAENNLGFVYHLANKPIEAHQHLNIARQIFSKLKDKGSVAQVDETRARVCLQEERNGDAAKIARAAEQALKDGGELSFLAEAKTTHGVALARLGRRDLAYTKLNQAAELAYNAGDVEGAGRAWLSILEELLSILDFKSMCALYKKADDVLRQSQDQASARRLRTVVAQILDVALSEKKSGISFTDGFSMDEAKRVFEEELITKALDASGGSVYRASKLLGVSHQNLGDKLKNRFKHLKPLGKRKERQKVKDIRPSNVSRMPNTFVIGRPLNISSHDKLITIDVEYEAFPGVAAGSMLVVKLCPVSDGDPVAVNLSPQKNKMSNYAVGYLKQEGSYIWLETDSLENRPNRYKTSDVGIEGLIIGYCSADDVSRNEIEDNPQKLNVYPLPARG